MTHPTLPDGFRITAHKVFNDTVFYIWKSSDEVGSYQFILGQGWVVNTRQRFDYPQDARDFLVGRYQRTADMNRRVADSMMENPVLAR